MSHDLAIPGQQPADLVGSEVLRRQHAAVAAIDQEQAMMVMSKLGAQIETLG